MLETIHRILQFYLQRHKKKIISPVFLATGMEVWKLQECWNIYSCCGFPVVWVSNTVKNENLVELKIQGNKLQ